MLQFLTIQGDVVYINPRLVSAVVSKKDDDWCQIFTDTTPWPVKGSAKEAQLRVWEMLTSA